MTRESTAHLFWEPSRVNVEGKCPAPSRESVTNISDVRQWLSLAKRLRDEAEAPNGESIFHVALPVLFIISKDI